MYSSKPDDKAAMAQMRIFEHLPIQCCDNMTIAEPHDGTGGQNFVIHKPDASNRCHRMPRRQPPSTARLLLVFVLSCAALPATADDATEAQATAPPDATPTVEQGPAEAVTETPAEAPTNVAPETQTETPTETAAEPTEAELAAAEAAAEVAARERELKRLEAERNAKRRALEAQYAEILDELEAEGGAYNPALSETLTGLGRAYKDLGLYDEAIEQLQRAAHITRVNEGLYSVAGVPILEQLIELHASRGDWEDVGARYQQMYSIQQRNYTDDEEQLLGAMEKLSSWHIKAYQEGIGNDPINHLISAQSLFQSSAQLMENNDDISDRQLAETLRQQAITNYYLASYVPTEQMNTFSWDVNANNSNRSDSAMAEQSFMIANFSSGREALSRVVDIYAQSPDASIEERADALAQLGDWNLMFGRRSTAVEYYQAALAVIEQGRTEGAPVPDDMFSKPVPLPIEPESMKTFDEAIPPEAHVGYVIIQFDVSMTGKVGDIDVIEAQPEDAEKAMRTLRKRLRGARFRPRFENGQPVPTEDMVYKYTYPLGEPG